MRTRRFHFQVLGARKRPDSVSIIAISGGLERHGLALLRRQRCESGCCLGSKCARDYRPRHHCSRTSSSRRYSGSTARHGVGHGSECGCRSNACGSGSPIHFPTAKRGTTLIKKALNEISALAWTLGGTGLVLITLSGDTARMGWWISGASLFLHMIGALFPFKVKDDETD